MFFRCKTQRGFPVSCPCVPPSPWCFCQFVGSLNLSFFKKAKLVYLKESNLVSIGKPMTLHVHSPPLHPCLLGMAEILASSCVGCNGQKQELQARDRKEQLEAATFLSPGRNQPISFSRVLPSYHSNQQLQSISAVWGLSEPRRCQGEDFGLVKWPRVKSQLLGGRGDPGMGK